MHPNPVFRQQTMDRNLAFARGRGFGTLSISADPVPMLAHVPFHIDDDGAYAELHLVRSNPIARAIQHPTPAIIAVAGPDGYISPDWYEDKGQVPTWNYIAVHVKGRLMPMDTAHIRAHLDRLSAEFEARLAPKKPWTTAKMPPEVLQRMMRQILPFRFTIDAIDGTWKLNQNKSAADRAGAAGALAQSPIGQDVATLAALMNKVTSQ